MAWHAFAHTHAPLDQVSHPATQTMQEASALAQLQAAFPLLGFDLQSTELLRRRRCIACTRVSTHMSALEPYNAFAHLFATLHTGWLHVRGLGSKS